MDWGAAAKPGRLLPAAQEQELAVSGRNWGAAAVQGSTLTFSVGGKPAFRVPLKDVGGVQQAPQEARGLRLGSSTVCRRLAPP